MASSPCVGVVTQPHLGGLDVGACCHKLFLKVISSLVTLLTFLHSSVPTLFASGPPITILRQQVDPILFHLGVVHWALVRSDCHKVSSRKARQLGLTFTRRFETYF